MTRPVVVFVVLLIGVGWPACHTAAADPRPGDPGTAEYKKAATLVSEAEAACKAGKSSVAADKAKAAMELLKK